jgi:molybdenum cofactor guanylyltransferase
VEKVKAISEISAIVLSGGKSLRLGGQKALEVVNGEILITRVINKVSIVAQEVLVVTNIKNSIQLDSLHKNVKIINDIYPETAALGAICTGLEYMESEFSLVVACDMPFLNVNLLKYMIDLSPEYEIVVPKINNFFEPLHGIYKKTCIKPIKQLINDKLLVVYKLFEIVKTRFVLEDEINRIDPDHFSFFNVNTKKDLDYANRIGKTIDIQY